MVVTATAPAPRVAAPAAGWDSRVVVLRGDDRAHLRERALAFVGFVEGQPDAALAELAAGLAVEPQPGGSRLAVVATSPADLLAKLRRAADRLIDPKHPQIRDAAGIYYFDQPLFTQGSLLLFPGEGAQYPNMLLDLCGVFAEVEETFAWCDRLAAEAGQPSLRAVLHPPPERLAEAEAELRKLGPSIFGVLIADLAVIKVLRNLEIPVSAVAGHSAGELAALLAAGGMNSEAVLGPRLAEIMDLMQRQEDEAGGPDVALLAVGAGKTTVVEVSDCNSRGAVVVAMDNCPHQCVAVGPTHLVAAMESAMLGRGLVCERLPFRRPYHTPLFEPWMGPFRELFADVPFEKPHTPVYCCSTGQRFPDDPDTIRDLAVNHWVSPVEFARMIETMYADGVRIFVEAGPRGNLSAFVEDVLRGRPFAAIPANVSRKSGPTQINHLVAQLVAHHVPLNLGHLFAGPNAGRTQSGREGVGPQDARRAASLPGASAPNTPLPLPHGRGLLDDVGVMNDYLTVMEQFLDVQRGVMEAFLAGHTTPASLPLDLFAIPDFAPTSNSALTKLPESPVFALVGRIEQLEPGRTIVIAASDGRARRPLRRRPHARRPRRQPRVIPARTGCRCCR